MLGKLIGKVVGAVGGGPLLGAGAALLGGALDRKQRRAEIAGTDPAAIRQKAEAAGFNPLLFTNQAFQGPNYAPTMGAAMADAGAMISNGMHRQKQLELQKTELEMERERLNNLVKKVTLNQRSGGIYSAQPRPAGGRRSTDPAALERYGHDETAAPDREVNVAPFTDAPGIARLNSGITFGYDLIVPGNDGEPMGVDELGTALLSVPFNLSYRIGEAAGKKHDEFRYQKRFRFGNDVSTPQERQDKRDKTPWWGWFNYGG